MRYLEIASGVRVVVSSEEQSILDTANGGIVKGLSNDPRKKELAHRMVGKGLLTLIKVDGKPVLAVNSINDIWRNKNDY